MTSTKAMPNPRANDNRWITGAATGTLAMKDDLPLVCPAKDAFVLSRRFRWATAAHLLNLFHIPFFRPPVTPAGCGFPVGPYGPQAINTTRQYKEACDAQVRIPQIHRQTL